MNNQKLPKPSGTLGTDIQGVWWLVSREDYNNEGLKRIDPVLGADPIGILTYTKSHFAAQFMKRDRTETVSAVSNTGANNTNAVGGYDAYFGKYEVNEQTGSVTHTLLGSITPANVGLSVSRDLRVSANRLTIQLETTTLDGELIVRTLMFEKLP